MARKAIMPAIFCWVLCLFLFLLGAEMPAAAQQAPGQLDQSKPAGALEAVWHGGSPRWFIEPIFFREPISNPISYRSAETEASGQSVFDAVEYTETPFVQEYSLPLREFLRGHIELGGFSSVYSMENVEWGPPAAGSLPAWGVTAQSHVAVCPPQQASSLGIGLTLHASSLDRDSGYLRPREWISWIVRNSKG